MNKLNLIMGAQNGAKTKREENDFYATHPDTVSKFLEASKNDFELKGLTWEPCCGLGHISEVLINNSYEVYSSDLIDRGYKKQYSTGDILDLEYEPIILPLDYNIMTNPPYKNIEKFIQSFLNRVLDNNYVILYVKLQCLEGQKRKKLFKEFPPKYIYIHSERQPIALNGNFEEYGKNSNSMAFCWIVWQKGYKGDSIIRWI